MGQIPRSTERISSSIRSCKSYFDFGSLSSRDNLALFQFTEKHIIHVYLLLKFALLAFKNIFERRVRHSLKR